MSKKRNKSKSPKFCVGYLVIKWVRIEVQAANEEQAKEKAYKILSKEEYNNPKIDVMDGREEYVGIENVTIIDKVYND